jgi:hypothetical protein
VSSPRSPHALRLGVPQAAFTQIHRTTTTNPASAPWLIEATVKTCGNHGKDVDSCSENDEWKDGMLPALVARRDKMSSLLLTVVLCGVGSAVSAAEPSAATPAPAATAAASTVPAPAEQPKKGPLGWFRDRVFGGKPAAKQPEPAKDAAKSPDAAKAPAKPPEVVQTSAKQPATLPPADDKAASKSEDSEDPHAPPKRRSYLGERRQKMGWTGN